MIRDEYVTAQMLRTAASLAHLAALRRIPMSIEVVDFNYVVNGTSMGCSVQGVMEWMDQQEKNKK